MLIGLSSSFILEVKTVGLFSWFSLLAYLVHCMTWKWKAKARSIFFHYAFSWVSNGNVLGFFCLFYSVIWIPFYNIFKPFLLVKEFQVRPLSRKILQLVSTPLNEGKNTDTCCRNLGAVTGRSTDPDQDKLLRDVGHADGTHVQPRRSHTYFWRWQYCSKRWNSRGLFSK